VRDVLAEIDRVDASGFREIALTGVHLGSYGHDLGDGSSLLDLLLAIDGQARDDVLFRISSLEPMDCGPEIVDLVARSRCFAPHFHLPLQHASDRILSGMRRPYTLADYSGLVDGIRARLPHAAIGSDIVVGFPGETADDFGVLMEYLRSSPLTGLHVFPYSDRPGTVAAGFPGKVDPAVVRERAAAVRGVGCLLRDRFRAAQIGTIRRGLTIEDGSMAVTDNYLKVQIGPGRRRNRWAEVRIAGPGDPMTGEALDDAVQTGLA
jgi:threonylcarbamoyladenosine tRNA methylthiotransferase MtaB